VATKVKPAIAEVPKPLADKKRKRDDDDTTPADTSSQGESSEKPVEAPVVDHRRTSGPISVLLQTQLIETTGGTLYDDIYAALTNLIVTRVNTCIPPPFESVSRDDTLQFQAFQDLSMAEKRTALLCALLATKWTTATQVHTGLTSKNIKERMCACVLKWMVSNDPKYLWEFVCDYWTAAE
jgi:hypothetical protein